MNQLQELLCPEVVRLDQRVGNWEEAIRLTGKLLLDQGGIEQEYIEHSVRAAEEMGAYFVIRPKVAISHARPGEGVNRVCVSLATLNPPVAFGHPDNDPVSLLFMFASLDDRSHLELLRSIAKLLGDDDLVERVIRAPTYGTLQRLMAEGL